VAIGANALDALTTPTGHVAIGFNAGGSLTVGDPTNGRLVVIGHETARSFNPTSDGSGTTVVGSFAGYSLTTGGSNTFLGGFAGYSVTTGVRNTFVGPDSGFNMTTGSQNVILGRYSGNQGGLDIRTASNYIVLSDGDGNPRLIITNGGDLRVPQVYNTTSGSAANVFIDSGGNFFRSTSSLKYKKEVTNAVHGLNELMQLRPVTYKGKSEADADKVFGGLIAEEVDALGLTEFVQYADDGSPDALAYGNMVSLCVKAIQELKQEVDSLKAQLNK
jgi:hypothetical protein